MSKFLKFLENHSHINLASESGREILAGAWAEESEGTVLTLSNLESVCGGCPQAWEARTQDDKEFYFRLRHGHWRIDIDDVTLVSGSSDKGADGCCSWEDAVRWAGQEGVALVVESHKPWEEIESHY